jgi:hypothetical protein
MQEKVYHIMNLFENLNIKDIKDIEDALELMAPSLAEYFIGESIGDEAYKVKSRDIQSVFVFGKYKIITKYDEEILIESKCPNDSDAFAELIKCLF